MHTSVSNPCTPRHPLSWATTKAVIVGALQRCCNVRCNVARYTDVVMKSELLAACVPIYDPLETSDLSVLLGVVSGSGCNSDRAPTGTGPCFPRGLGALPSCCARPVWFAHGTLTRQVGRLRVLIARPAWT